MNFNHPNEILAGGSQMLVRPNYHPAFPDAYIAPSLSEAMLHSSYRNEEFGEVRRPSSSSDFAVLNIVWTFEQIKPPCGGFLSPRQASQEEWTTDTVYHLDSAAPNLPPSPRSQGNLMQGLRSG
jgi:hypothetical protein